MHKKIYTGIGSRETPAGVLHTMNRIGATMGYHGWTLRSGHAQGADQHFERGALYSSGKMEIYLPWDGFEGARQDGVKYFTGFSTPEIEWIAENVAAHFHPAWHNCTQGAKKMHSRNVQQVGGKDLDLASDLVICWTKDGKRRGGTGQALRIAEYLNIPIFDLAVCTLDQVANFMNRGELPW